MNLINQIQAQIKLWSNNRHRAKLQREIDKFKIEHPDIAAQVQEENRLRAQGYRFCHSCGRIGGMKYDGRGITLRNIATEKGRFDFCTECIVNAYNAVKKKREAQNV